MTVDIKPQNSQQSVPGFPKTQSYDIYAGTTHNFNFLWQTSKNTESGYYIITMTSSVPDTKCEQSNLIPLTKTQTVYIAPSLDGCRAELSNIDVSVVNSSQALSTYTAEITGSHLNVYQNWSYSNIDSCITETAERTGGKIFNTNCT